MANCSNEATLIKNNGLCPVCGKEVTVGVMARVEQLADRPEGEKPPRWRPFENLVPLPEIIAETKSMGVASKAVQQVYWQMLSKLGNELSLLQDASLKDIERVAGDSVALAIDRMRRKEIFIAAGYDGEYGEIHIFSPEDRSVKENQLSLF